MKFKKKTKKGIAYTLLTISTFILIFNNIGQAFTLVNVPFTKNIQMYAGFIGAVLSFVWYSYLQGAIR